MDTSLYFYRTVVFTRADGQIALADIYNPNLTSPLESWLGIVVSLADGKHTLAQLIEYLASQYPGNPPEALEATIASVVERLAEGELVKTSEEPVELPYYLAQPIERLDLEKARQLMHADGYTRH